MKFFLRLSTFLLLSFVLLACVSEIRPTNSTTTSSAATVQMQHLEIGQTINAIDGITISAYEEGMRIPIESLELSLARANDDLLTTHPIAPVYGEVVQAYEMTFKPNSFLGVSVSVTIPLPKNHPIEEYDIFHLFYKPNAIMLFPPEYTENPLAPHLYAWMGNSSSRYNKEEHSLTFSASSASSSRHIYEEGKLYFTLQRRQQSQSHTPSHQPLQTANITHLFEVTCDSSVSKDDCATNKPKISQAMQDAYNHYYSIKAPQFLLPKLAKDSTTGRYKIEITTKAHCPRNAEAFYSPLSNNEMIFFCLPLTLNYDDIAKHELFHAIQHAHSSYNLQGYPQNSWFIEGTAVAAENSADVMQSSVYRPYRTVTSSLLMSDRLIAYSTQSFWVFAGKKANVGLNYLIPFLEGFTQIPTINHYDNKFAEMAEYDGLADVYWQWVKNQAYEATIRYHTVFDYCSIRENLYNYPSFDPENPIDQPFLETTLPPLTSRVLKIDYEGIKSNEPYDVFVRVEGSNIKYQVYEITSQRQDTFTNCHNKPDPVGETYSVKGLQNGSVTYIIVSNVDLHNEQNVKVEIIRDGRVAMVIDDTGSMTSPITSIQNSLRNTLDTTDPEKDLDFSWSLITFKDNVTTRAVNVSTNRIASHVNALSASGGGDCPEEGLGALNRASQILAQSRDGKQRTIIFATDASPKGDNASVAPILANLIQNDVKVHVLLTGDCVVVDDPPPYGSSKEKSENNDALSQSSQGTGQNNSSQSVLSSQEVYKQIADETGGLYFYLPNGSTSEFDNALTEIFAETINPKPHTVATLIEYIREMSITGLASESLRNYLIWKLEQAQSFIANDYLPLAFYHLDGVDNWTRLHDGSSISNADAIVIYQAIAKIKSKLQ